MSNTTKQFVSDAETLVAEQKNPQSNVSTASTKFISSVGSYISEQESQKLRSAFFKREKEKYNHENFYRAHFFGKDKLQELLTYHSEVVGMRLYYGVDVDSDGTDNKKFVLYPVDKTGKDILMGGKSLDGGVSCPFECPFFEAGTYVPNANETSVSTKFVASVGTYISEQEAQKLRAAFFKKEKEIYNREDFYRAFFFGKDKLQELLNYNSDIVGMRVYYGVDVDSIGTDDKKLVLYPVDKSGNDVLMNGNSLDAGLPCPEFCPIF
jgi:hypothetical protein